MRKANVFKSERRPLNKSEQEQRVPIKLRNNFLGNPAWSESVQESRKVLENPVEEQRLENHQLHPHGSRLL